MGEEKKIKLLMMADFISPTGFGNVAMSLAKFLNKTERYDISVLAINYNGFPNELQSSYKIYPAKSGPSGDPYGFDVTKKIVAEVEPDLIWILNDIWIITQYLDRIRDLFDDQAPDFKKPKISIYFPVDAEDHNLGWYTNLDMVDSVNVYTEFGKAVVNKVVPDLDVNIMKHGVDASMFYKIAGTQAEIKGRLYPQIEEMLNSFVVLNANRNQSRKKLDVTMSGFALFAEDKPSNVKLYMHCGIEDSAINVIAMAERLHIEKRLIVTDKNAKGAMKVPTHILNLIYNSTDVGVNTAVGEGWSLTNMEHAITGAPQLVADHSALHELYEDCGLLIPAKIPYVLDKSMTTGYLCLAEDVASALQRVYENKDLYNELSFKAYKKFTSKEYSWEFIANVWDEEFKRIL